MTTFEEQARQQLDDQHTIRVKHESIKAYQLMGAVILVVIGIWIGAQVFSNDPGFTVNLYTEALSVLVTVLVIKWFDDRRSRNERKKALMRQLSSQSNEFALEAKRLLEMEDGWLEEALLEGNFERANWAGIVLEWADLENMRFAHTNLTNAQLEHANLTGANLWQTILIGANLRRVDFEGAYLRGANLSNAVLWHSNLRYTNLSETNLFGTDLTGADLSWAFLSNAQFDKTTILPDRKHWTPDKDLTCFTDPDHPDFLPPSHIFSPRFAARYRKKQNEV